MVDIESLNLSQKSAVLCNKDKIMVMAGAGAGKTKVLTTRISYLIENGVSPENILALTFTNKAANEMKERIERITGVSPNRINATTFHSFFVKVLRRYISPTFPQFNKNFKILDEDDVKKMFEKLIEKYGYDQKDIRKIQSERTDKLLGRITFKSKYEKLIKEFEEQLAASNSLTFDCLLAKAYRVFLNDKNALAYYQNCFQYILVDEFQDTDDIQYEILKMLCDVHKKLFVVGDDYQCIYGFRGANVLNIQEFMKDYPDFELIKLEQNYRSTPEIINLANEVIKYNTNQIQKTLFTQNQSGFMPEFNFFSSNKTEASFIAEKIDTLVKLQKNNYKDFTILYRVNSLSRSFEDELIKHKIPYIIYNGTGFYQREEIKDMIAFISLVADPYDNLSFERIINKPKKEIGDSKIEQIRNIAISKETPTHYSMLKACDDYLGIHSNRVSKFMHDVKKARDLYKTAGYSMSDLVNYFITIMNYSDYLVTLKSSSTNDRFANIDEFKNVIADFEAKNDCESEPNTVDYIFEFLQTMRLYSNVDVNEDKENENAVKLMTIHASKGLEFPIVFLPAMESEIFPSYRAETIEAIEEERRLFYVGITRAKQTLYLSSVNFRYIYNSNRKQSISQFISEIHESKKLKLNDRS